MRPRWQVVCLATLMCPLAVRAGEAVPGSCEASVGAWEFTPPSGPGRGVIAKVGSTYHSAFVWTRATTANERSAVAQECTCLGSGGKLQWTCRVLFAIDQADVGAEWKFEWVLQGDNLKSWGIKPDGTRADPVFAKHLK